MTLDEILQLPFVGNYQLDDEPADFDDLCELCEEFEFIENMDPDVAGDHIVIFPVGPEYSVSSDDTVEGEQVHEQPCDEPKLLQEAPIVFSVSEGVYTDYGVVNGTTLSVYRHIA